MPVGSVANTSPVAGFTTSSTPAAAATPLRAPKQPRLRRAIGPALRRAIGCVRCDLCRRQRSSYSRARGLGAWLPFFGGRDGQDGYRRPLERETTPSRVTRACVALIAGRGSNNMAKRAYSSCEHLDGMCEKRLYCCIMHLISTTARLKTAALQALELCCLWRRWHALAARTVLRVPRAATRLPCVCRPTWPASPADCWSPAARRRRPTVRSRRAPEPRSNAPAGRCCQSSLTSHGTILYHCWHKRRLCRLHLFPHICAHSPCAARPAAANSIAVLAATTCTTPPSIERRRRRRRRSRRAPPASCPAPWQ